MIRYQQPAKQVLRPFHTAATETELIKTHKGPLATGHLGLQCKYSKIKSRLCKR